MVIILPTFGLTSGQVGLCSKSLRTIKYPCLLHNPGSNADVGHFFRLCESHSCSKFMPSPVLQFNVMDLGDG